MKVIPVNLTEAMNVTLNILKNKDEACIFCIADKPCIVGGIQNDFNLNEIEKNNIQLLQLQNEGGTIVAGQGDIGIGILTIGDSGLTYRNNIIKDIVDLLKAKNCNFVFDNNDIMIDNKKVISFSSRKYGEILYIAMYFSMDANLQLIQKICTKPMRKIPGGLKHYNITTEEIANIIYNNFK